MQLSRPILFSMSDRPFFVVGCPRSGTTLLRTILDGHSRLSIPPESHFVVALERRARRGAVTLDDIIAHPEFSAWNADTDALRRWVDDAAPTSYPELVSAVFDWYAVRNGKQRWGDKTPGYVSYLPHLLRLFPDAQFVHVLRDGRDVVASLSEQVWGPKRPVVGALRWRRKVGAGRRAGARMGADSYIELKLEDLIIDPETKIRELCDFLGEEFQANMLEFQARAHALFPKDDNVTARVRQPLATGLRDWRSGMSVREQRSVEALCHRQLVRLGYKTERWSMGDAVYGWLGVFIYAWGRAPTAIRTRLNSRRRAY
jgi:Sulfotransferase family